MPIIIVACVIVCLMTYNILVVMTDNSNKYILHTSIVLCILSLWMILANNNRYTVPCVVTNHEIHQPKSDTGSSCQYILYENEYINLTKITHQIYDPNTMISRNVYNQFSYGIRFTPHIEYEVIEERDE